MIYRDRTEQLASDLLSREYGKDHPAARHTFALTFRTTTHAHQVRELASALRRAEARAWREAAKLTMELAPPGVRLPLRDEFLERADALEKAGGER